MSVKKIVLCVTSACNLTCEYCNQEKLYQQICLEKDMSLEIALTATNLLPRGGEVGFFGGEPTLKMNLIRLVVEKNHGKSFAIFTNGTADFETYRWLARKKFRFSISYDGEGSKRGREKEIFKTIKKLAEIGTIPRVRITITPTSDFLSTVQKLVEIGIKKIWFEFDDGLVGHPELFEDFISFQRKKIQKAFSFSSRKGVELYNSFMLSGPCDSRRGKMLWVLPDGGLFLCHKEFSFESSVGNVKDPPEKIFREIKEKKISFQSPSLCILMTKKVTQFNFLDFLRKEETMHNEKKFFVLAGKVQQLGEAAEAISNRLKNVSDDLQKLLEEEKKGIKEGANCP